MKILNFSKIYSYINRNWSKSWLRKIDLIICLSSKKIEKNKFFDIDRSNNNIII